jgi:hypothetical protein
MWSGTPWRPWPDCNGCTPTASPVAIAARPVRCCRADGSDLAALLRAEPEPAVLEGASSWLAQQEGLGKEIGLRPDSTGRQQFVHRSSGEALPLYLAGEGLRALLPILLCTLWAETGAPGAPTMLAVEEPEAHLHPTLQVALFDRLVESMRAGLPVALETHSAYLLRAMQLAVLAVDSLQDATESFKRINSSGTPMTDFNMVSALAYRDDFDSQELFDQHRSERLESLGWQQLPDMDLLRVCAALAGQHPAKMEVDKLAERLEAQRDLVERAFCAVADAARTIGELCGIAGPEVLPYSWQLITLAVCVGADGADLSRPKTREAIRRWFWLTTYGEVYAGVNSAIYDRSRKALRDMMRGGTPAAMARDLTQQVRPSGAFDFRAARAKATALVMARYQDHGDLSGPAHRALADGAEVMGVLQASGRRSDWWNRVVRTEISIDPYRTALKDRANGRSTPEGDALLADIGIAADAGGTVAELLSARRETIADAERRFVAELDLQWADAG